MNNPFENLPLNTKRVYVMGVCSTGCEVYIPFDSFDKNDQLLKKQQLQQYLDENDCFFPPFPPKAA